MDVFVASAIHCLLVVHKHDEVERVVSRLLIVLWRQVFELQVVYVLAPDAAVCAVPLSECVIFVMIALLLIAQRILFALIRILVFAVLGGLTVGASLNFNALLDYPVDLVLGELAVDLGTRAL